MSTTKVTDAMIDGVAASKLTGALPAISGASLTALPATLPASSGVNLTALNATNLGSGTASVARGGTGAGTHTANNVLVGNGTSAIASVAPSTSGNLLTSNGSAWTSAAAAGGGKVQQIVFNDVHTEASGTGTFATDDSIPQISEGNQVLTIAITPTSATSKLKIDIVVNIVSSASNSALVVALFQDSTANALACQMMYATSGSDYNIALPLSHTMTSGTTSETTFYVRVGGPSGTTYLNKKVSASVYNDTLCSSLSIMEYTP